MRFIAILLTYALAELNYTDAQNVTLGCNPTCAPGSKCMINVCVKNVTCAPAAKFGTGPPAKCAKLPSDPNKLPKSPIENWFSKEVFADLFPKANIGWGPNSCWPYSYEAFVIASRYFPKFGTESPTNGYTPEQNYKRDLAAFFAHAVQETGENDASLYLNKANLSTADDCFYRGGFYNWFEGGPVSVFVPNSGFQPEDGEKCISAGQYCVKTPDEDYFFPCNNATDGDYFKGCYFGRGAIQLSYNFNYGQFQQWLTSINLPFNLLAQPNLLMTSTDPPLAILASLWFYMTPQPPKPAMHDLVLGQWEPGPKNRRGGYEGAAFGPTSLVINNECNGEDKTNPGGPGESRRIKAFKWFCKYFGVPVGNQSLLTCKNMPQPFDQLNVPVSWQPDWQTTWKEIPCNCAPATYGGEILYYAPVYFPKKFVSLNEANRKRCVKSIYERPGMYSLNAETSPCLNHPSPDLPNFIPKTNKTAATATPDNNFEATNHINRKV